MKLSRAGLALLMTLFVGASAACGSSGSSCLLCGDFDLGPYDVFGQVFDDNGNLPPGADGRQPVEGVKVEVIDGSEQGRFAMTDATGRFNLGTISYLGRVRASKEGWEPNERWFLCCKLALDVVIGQAPHTLWGQVLLPDRTPAEGVGVEVVTGPDMGKVKITDDRGYYRLDGLGTQPRFTVQFSKAGYRTDRVDVPLDPPLYQNLRRNWTLFPE